MFVIKYNFYYRVVEYWNSDLRFFYVIALLMLDIYCSHKNLPYNNLKKMKLLQEWIRLYKKRAIPFEMTLFIQCFNVFMGKISFRLLRNRE
jgi:hypothetical protein